jgi:hypothetical protein
VTDGTGRSNSIRSDSGEGKIARPGQDGRDREGEKHMVGLQARCEAIPTIWGMKLDEGRWKEQQAYLGMDGLSIIT